MDNINNKYNLEERTTKFAESIINFAKMIPINEITRPIIGQLIKAGTSTGANYQEANNAESKKDFRHKIGICKKEVSETAFWVQITVRAIPNLAEDARPIWQEAKELKLIFGAINRKK